LNVVPQTVVISLLRYVTLLMYDYEKMTPSAADGVAECCLKK